MTEEYRDIVEKESNGQDLWWPIAIHPKQDSGIIIINYPGYNGDIDGFNNKYGKLAQFMQEKIGAVLRSPNIEHNNIDYRESVKDDLKALIEYALKNSERICGSVNPQIYLMGFSAGASAIAAVAHEFKEVTKILLVSPSMDAGPEAVLYGLNHFTGEVYVVAGDNDTIVGTKCAPQMFSYVKTDSTHEIVIVQNCDHQFKGKTNGMIMSKAPLWAFSGDTSFPDPEGGIELY